MKTRESWLLSAVHRFRPWFEREGVHKPLPEDIRVSVGFAKGAKSSAIGWCYKSVAAEDTINQIFISPALVDPTVVLATLLHECVHAADDCNSAHTGEFRRVAKALGLEGKMTATYAGDALSGVLAELAEDLGEYEHGKLTAGLRGTGGPAQKNRQLKIVCLADGCNYKLRGSRTILDLGIPDCPIHGEEMVEDV